MEIYSTYESASIIFSLFAKSYTQLFTLSVCTGFLIWLALFILQGVGIYTMAKKRELKKRWLAFVPFVNIWYLAKLAGECHAFGHKVKRVGIYAMITQIITVILTVMMIAAEIYLYINHGDPITQGYFLNPSWADTTGFSRTVEIFYFYTSFSLSILQLLFGVLMMIIMTALCKKYTPKNFMGLSMLAFFIPLSRFIIIFCIRNRKEVDYEAYVRKQREEFARRQQQYRNMYGNPYNPYNNPYGNPYYRGNPYGQNNTQNQEDKPKEEPKDEPFSEFASDTKSDNSSANTAQGNTNGKDDPDDFFS